MNLNGGWCSSYVSKIYIYIYNNKSNNNDNMYIYIFMCLQTTVVNSKQFPVHIQTNVENPLPADPRLFHIYGSLKN